MVNQHLAHDQDYRDETDGPPGPQGPVTPFARAQDIHAERFEKRDQRRVEDAVDQSDEEHRGETVGGQVEGPGRGAGQAAADEDGSPSLEAVRQDRPNQSADHQHHRAQGRDDPDLEAGKTDMVAVEVKIRQVDAEDAEVEEVLQAQQGQMWSGAIRFHRPHDTLKRHPGIVCHSTAMGTLRAFSLSGLGMRISKTPSLKRAETEAGSTVACMLKERRKVPQSRSRRT